jgi:sortase (surface protein transpeptidase)
MDEEGQTGANIPLPEEKTEDTEIVDDKYYERGGVTYTPDFAKGALDCVLEIPSISLKRGVYTGTRQEIEYDLSIWMTTAASPDLKLGETHYAIYGHNHLVQDLSFNRLKDVQLGDLFTLTKEDRVYAYKVTDIFADWRSSGRKKYAANMNQDSSLCFIFTCGRDHWLLNGQSTRYKDYIVEGTLQAVYSVTEWRDKESISSCQETETVTFVARNLVKTKLEIQAESDADGITLKVAQIDEKGRFVQGSVLSALDSDGIEVISWVQEESFKKIHLPEGTWVIAVTDQDDKYEEPPGKEIRVKESMTKIITIGEETEEKAVSNTETLFLISMIAAVLTAVFLTLFVVSIVKRNHGNDLSGNDQAG